jgi:hypothetical protein
VPSIICGLPHSMVRRGHRFDPDSKRTLLFKRNLTAF